ncbi:NlpC/P60 family protein [Pseudofrankia sp. DC12]|uniref:NlpC/P60 family protein n=1 Tax=Pseudofrankia sp. DC12 TaxID=683315 RepID=UPI0005F85D9B
MGAAAGQFAERALCVPVVGWFLGCTSGGSPSQTALDDIPTDYLALYMQAATTCPGLSWTTLAAIGEVESDHGRSRLPGVASGTNSAGAGGPMQFLAPTFAAVVAHHQLPAGGANPPSLYNPQDAVYAAAAYLCDNHAATDLTGALWNYNHSDAYIAQVLTQATQYSEPNPNASVACATFQSSFQSGIDHFSSVALTAVQFACGQIGKPYVWGGNGEPGFDCSGLTAAAYAVAGVQIPRTAQGQYNAGPLVSAGWPLLPGDLVFFGGGPAAVAHVGIFLGIQNGQAMIVDAPHEGAYVRVEPFPATVGARWGSEFYLGASTPAGG